MGLNEQGLAPVVLVALVLLLSFLGLGMTGAWDPLCMENAPEYGTPCWKEPVAPPRPGAPLPPPENYDPIAAGAPNINTVDMVQKIADTVKKLKASGKPEEAQAAARLEAIQAKPLHKDSDAVEQAGKWPWPNEVSVWIEPNEKDFTLRVPLFNPDLFTYYEVPSYEWALPTLKVNDLDAKAETQKLAASLAMLNYAPVPTNPEAIKYYRGLPNPRELVDGGSRRVQLGVQGFDYYFTAQVVDPEKDGSQFGNEPYYLEIKSNDATAGSWTTLINDMWAEGTPERVLYAVLTPFYGPWQEETPNPNRAILVRVNVYLPAVALQALMREDRFAKARKCLEEEKNDSGELDCRDAAGGLALDPKRVEQLNEKYETKAGKKDGIQRVREYLRIAAHEMQLNALGGKPMDLFSFTYVDDELKKPDAEKVDTRVDLFTARQLNPALQPNVVAVVLHPRGRYGTGMSGPSAISTAALLLRGDTEEIRIEGELTPAERHWVTYPNFYASVGAATFTFPLSGMPADGTRYRVELELDGKRVPLNYRTLLDGPPLESVRMVNYQFIPATPALPP